MVVLLAIGAFGILGVIVTLSVWNPEWSRHLSRRRNPRYVA